MVMFFETNLLYMFIIYINIQDMEHITILFPGGFKPITPAHIKLMSKVKSFYNVKEIILFIGHKERDNITRDNSIHLIKNILGLDVTVYDSCIKSPVLQIYEFMKTRENGIYTLLASQKDDPTRVKNFYEKHKKGGKFNTGKFDVVLLNDNIYDVMKLNDTIISASDIRNVIRDNNFDGFNAYEYDEDKKLKIYEYLNKLLCQH